MLKSQDTTLNKTFYYAQKSRHYTQQDFLLCSRVKTLHSTRLSTMLKSQDTTLNKTLYYARESRHYTQQDTTLMGAGESPRQCTVSDYNSGFSRLFSDNHTLLNGGEFTYATYVFAKQDHLQVALSLIWFITYISSDSTLIKCSHVYSITSVL